MNSDSVVYVVSAAISVCVTIPIAVTGIMTCNTIGRGNDPARRSFTWLKGAYTLIFLSHLFTIISYILFSLLFSKYLRSNDDLDAADLIIAMTVTGVASNYVGDACLIMTFIELGNGFEYALFLKRSETQKRWRLFGALLSGFIVVMGIAAAAYLGYRTSQTFGGVSSSYSLTRGMRQASKVEVVSSVFHFVAALGLVAQASLIRHKYNPDLLATNSTTLYLVAAILNLAPRSLWQFISSLALVTGNDSGLTDRFVSLPTSVVCSHVVSMIILILLFVVGIRKRNGLWTTMKPWMEGPPPSTADAQAPERYYGEPPYANGFISSQTGAGSSLPGQGYSQPGQLQLDPLQVPVESDGMPISEVSGGEVAHMMPSMSVRSASPQDYIHGNSLQPGSDQVIYEKP